MASEDVIELGSSDDEAEPAPKKKKTMSKPDAMVNIPSNLRGVTIVPIKSKSSSSLSGKGILKKPIIVNNPNFDYNSTTNKLNLNSGTSRPSIKIKNFGNSIKKVPTLQNKYSLNPLCIAKNLNNSQIVVNKIPTSKRQRSSLEVQGKEVLNNLPPGITIKPLHTAEVTIIPIQKAGVSGLGRKIKLVAPKTNQSGQLMTVDIDDEDITEYKTCSPQWYLRPEEQIESAKVNTGDKDILHSVEPSMEEENNREPDRTKFVEITIDDTPVKSVQPRHPDIGKELTITIEDSPIKPAQEIVKDVESDTELSEVTDSKCPQSKKKLNFPKKQKEINEPQVVEIEIDLKDSNTIEDSEGNNKIDLPKDNSDIDIKKSLKQKTQVENENLEKKEINAEIIQSKDNITTDADDEFHPTYQKFICTCFQLEDTEDMKKIVERKIKSYYRQCSKDYVESEEFLDMVSSKIASMKASPKKMYLFIKDVVDELNLQRKMTKKTTQNVDVEKEISDVKYEETQYDNKKRRQIRKLEKTIKKLHRAIQKLEEQEVDFDDDEDSVYLLTERYKERMVRVHAKFCQLTNTKMPSEPRIHIEARPGRPTGPAKRLEKWINRTVPIGTPMPFPDFHDVLRCVRDANEEDKLGWNDTDITEEARDLFTRCGKKLQRRRQENEWRIAASRIPVDADPAEESIDLKRKLDENKTMAATKEVELLDKYVDRQDLLKLEAEEIGDKEAEESPVESEEDEEVVDDNSLDKEKRKQRLKRLIEEKSKKEENKENDIEKDLEEKENEVDKKEDLNEATTEKKPEEADSNSDEIVTEHSKTTEKKTESASAIDQKQNENYDSDYKVESDLDEFNLLQKLYSENEANTSALETSDSDTPIAISDIDSDSEGETYTKSFDVISIENSSYSEDESTMDELSKGNDAISSNMSELVNSNIEIEYCSTGIQKNSKDIASKDTIVEEIEENILLESSDEEAEEKLKTFNIEDTCVNLKDDSLSISETVVDGVINEKEIVSSDENTMQENNNHVQIIDRDPETEQNNCALLNIERDQLEHVHLDCNEFIQKSSNGEDATYCENNLPKDVVDIRNTSVVALVESVDLINDNEK